MLKTYQIFYVIKRNKREEVNHMFIVSNSAKEACRKCKETVYEKYGRNAFRPTTKIENLIK